MLLRMDHGVLQFRLAHLGVTQGQPEMSNGIGRSLNIRSASTLRCVALRSRLKLVAYPHNWVKPIAV